jgi:hypothetical protein
VRCAHYLHPCDSGVTLLRILQGSQTMKAAFHRDALVSPCRTVRDRRLDTARRLQRTQFDLLACSHGAMSPCGRRDRHLDTAMRLQRATTELVKRNSDNFVLVGPPFGRPAQVRSYRIHAHILPFLRVARRTTQQVVEKALLPVRLLNSYAEQTFANHSAQRLNLAR